MSKPKQTIDPNHKMQPWLQAGLMHSYWCSASCEFCYVSSCPAHTFWATAKQIVDRWKQLDELAIRYGSRVKIHLTGGEVFGNWELLVEVLEQARGANLPPVEKIETNAFWAVDDAVVRDRLTTLKKLGMTLITSDADIFHQQFVPIDRVRRLVEIAREILEPEGIRVRWWDFYEAAIENHLDVNDLTSEELQELQIDALTRGRERLNGRAAVLAAKLIKGKPIDAFAGDACDKGILRSKHVHIDPYGNIFPGTCCGIVLGSTLCENIADVYDWLDTKGPTGPILETLITQGPAGIVELAKRYGFRPLKNGYVSKCQLCYHLRSTLYQAGQFKKWLGPEQAYPPIDWFA
jgi:hypothetical protein